MSRAQRLKVSLLQDSSSESEDYPWLGEYTMQYNTKNSNIGHWKHKNSKWFLYRDGFKWHISNSAYQYAPENIVAIKMHVTGDTPTGDYEGTAYNPDLVVEWIDFP